MKTFCIVLITAPRNMVKKLAMSLLKKRLAACVNVLPQITSHFRWKGKIETGKEMLLVVKTRRSLFGALAAEVSKIHPYEVPEIVMVPILKGSKKYLDWLADETR